MMISFSVAIYRY